MYNWFRKREDPAQKNEQVEQALSMFEQLESGSFLGDVHNESDLRMLNKTIKLASDLRSILMRNKASKTPLVMPPLSLTQVYLASALTSRVQYYRQRVTSLTGFSFHMPGELAEKVQSTPEAQKHLEAMLADLDLLLSEEMHDDVGIRDLKVEWRDQCLRALGEHRSCD